LEEHVEAYVNDSCVQENGCNETPPLVWLMASVVEFCDASLVGDAAAHAAELGQGTFRRLCVDGGGVGTWPIENGRVGFDHLLDVVHAGREAGTHVDQNVG